LYLQGEPNETTKEGPLSSVLFESPFTSVSTISRGHPSLVSLVLAIAVLLSFNFAVVVNFNVFLFPSSKAISINNKKCTELLAAFPLFELFSFSEIRRYIREMVMEIEMAREMEIERQMKIW
jgi:hypothetical protein